MLPVVCGAVGVVVVEVLVVVVGDDVKHGGHTFPQRHVSLSLSYRSPRSFRQLLTTVQQIPRFRFDVSPYYVVVQHIEQSHSSQPILTPQKDPSLSKVWYLM